MTLPIVIRDVEEEDIPYICNSWIRSYAHSNTVCWANRTHFKERWHPVVHALLEGCTLRVVANPEDTGSVWGYICFSDEHLHYVHVRQWLRVKELEVTKRLLQEFPKIGDERIVVTHWNDWCEKQDNFLFRPSILKGAYNGRVPRKKNNPG